MGKLIFKPVKSFLSKPVSWIVAILSLFLMFSTEAYSANFVVRDQPILARTPLLASPKAPNLQNPQLTYIVSPLGQATKSYFQMDIDSKKDSDKNLLAAKGTQSGGGGHWLELEMYKTFQLLYEKLKVSNPDKINLNDFYNLIQNLKLEISDKPLYLDGVAKDAINYFPQQLRLKIDKNRWTEHFDNKRDVLSLVYHELLPYFFGNDLKYKVSRNRSFSPSEIATFENMDDADFFELEAESWECLVHVAVEKPDNIISVTWIDNYYSGKTCNARGFGFRVKCPNSTFLNCKAADEGADPLFFFNILSPTRMEFGRKSSHDRIFSYSRVHRDRRETVISDFESTVVAEDLSLDYSRICQKAFDSARVTALSRCEKSVANAKEKCKVLESEPLPADVPRNPNRCMIRVKVKKLLL